MVEFRRKKNEKDDPDLCSVKGCQEPVKRKLSGKAVSKAVPDFKWKVKDPKKVRLCKEHYKVWFARMHCEYVDTDDQEE